MNQTASIPSSNKSRIISIDALRGFALAGVAIVHMVEQYIAGPHPEGFMEGVNGLPDQIVQGILQLFFTGKFFALFSILFGLSFFIQMDSADQKGQDFGKRFLWRAALLFLIGYVHQLFYRGDILTIYAFLAPFLIPFYRLSTKWLLGIAIFIFLGIPRFIAFALIGSDGITGVHAMMDNNHPMVQQYIQLLQEGSLTDVFVSNATYGMMTKIDFQVSLFGRLYYTFGYFLIGLWLGRIGLFKDLATWTKKINTALLWSLAGFLLSVGVGIAAFASGSNPPDFSSWSFVLGINFFDWANIFMTSMILCGFLLLYQKTKWERALSFFAPYGRMALTNYVMQSIIGTMIFFNWGLGYIGQVRALYCFLIGIAVVILQTLFSKFWLAHFRFGPLEWLWRCGTYFKWQSMRKSTPQLQVNN